jgi:hypothetical protein
MGEGSTSFLLKVAENGRVVTGERARWMTALRRQIISWRLPRARPDSALGEVGVGFPPCHGPCRTAAFAFV